MFNGDQHRNHTSSVEVNLYIKKIKNKTYIVWVNTKTLQENPGVSKQNETIKWKKRRKETWLTHGATESLKFVGFKNLSEEDNATL